MLRQIINASSKPGDVVADFFMGSGSTVKIALELGRQAIGVELEEDRFSQTVEEIRALTGINVRSLKRPFYYLNNTRTQRGERP
ncbi:DNA methylase [Escherichia coli]|uniref:DNA methylase n=1 Tax=Escherichia coli TaxID=562 RepID=A0A377BIY9_ECOLX|nr:DNA methylase [Escherichia coli]